MDKVQLVRAVMEAAAALLLEKGIEVRLITVATPDEIYIMGDAKNASEER